MVHALGECRRVLTAEGLLIDLRPVVGDWPLQVVTGSQVAVAGPLDGSLAAPDDRAANAAIATAVQAGWFRAESGTTFPFAWYWDSLAELDAYIAARWTNAFRIPPATRAAAVRLLGEAGPGARLRIPRGMLLARYRALAHKPRITRETWSS